MKFYVHIKIKILIRAVYLCEFNGFQTNQPYCGSNDNNSTGASLSEILFSLMLNKYIVCDASPASRLFTRPFIQAQIK